MAEGVRPARDKNGNDRPGVYEIRISLGTNPLDATKRRTLSRTFHGTKREAQRARAALMVGTVDERGSEHSVAYLLERYLTERCAAKLADSTLVHYRYRVHSRLIPAFGHLQLRKLTAGHLQDFYDALTKAGRQPSDVRQYHAIMRGALNYAKQHGWVASNVALDADPPKIGDSELHPPAIDVVLDLIDLAAKTRPEFAVFLRVVIATGARRGEVCALRWSDFNGPVVKISRNIVDGLGRGIAPKEKGTKTHAVRTFRVDDETAELLADHARRMQRRAEAGGHTIGKDAFVFSHEPDGSKCWRPEYTTLIFRRLVQKLRDDGKLAEGQRVRLHDLRHAAATLLIDSGVPLPTVSRRLGHRRQSTTIDIYVHHRDERDQEAADVTGRALTRAAIAPDLAGDGPSPQPNGGRQAKARTKPADKVSAGSGNSAWRRRHW